MNICLLLGYFPDMIVDEISQNTKSSYQDAANILQCHIIEGLSNFYSKIEIINAPFLGYYPTKYKTNYSPSCEYMYLKNKATISVDSFKFNTDPVLFGYSREKGTYKRLLNWMHDKDACQNVIIVYSVHRPFLEACMRLKKKYPTVKIILIIPDLPEFMNSSKALLSRIHQRMNHIYKFRLQYLYNQMDGFVFLTEAMNEKINKGSKPYTIIEGISKPSELDAVKIERYIYYSGTLAEKYGIMNLVNAFLKIQHKDYKLILCGDGDTVETIKKISLDNKNIVYLGKIDNRKAIEYQLKATLLINPRQNLSLYTKYSFPSKIMEYFASGRPSLMYKLDGVLEEYYDYCFTLDNNSIDALSLKIDEILNLSEDCLSKIGQNARNFLINNKNPEMQCRKLESLINIVFKK